MTKDLTVGSPAKVLCMFSIPMVISVIFQQLYNLADSMIAGRFAGEDALAAVGASYPITMIFMAVAVGCNIGCAVVISQLFGAREYREVKEAASTTILASLVLSVVLTILGLALTVPLMKLIQTPDNIFADGVLYLRIYIAGLVFLFLYNICNGIFTSLGDSKTPLYFLIGSSVGNIGLDYLFVAGFGWGVAGVAWATFIAQGVACILALVTLLFRIRKIPSEGKAPLFSWEMLRRVSLIAVPSILQQSFISVGNIFIQGLVNSFGSSVIAGYSAAIKLNTFSVTAFSSLSNSLSSFAAQNLGAGKEDRVRSGLRAGTLISLITAGIFFLLLTLFSSAMISLFMDEGSRQALDTGVTFLRIVAPFYLVISIKLAIDGVLRGAGAMKCFMISTFTDLILRVVLAFILAIPFGVTGVWLSWPVGWLASTGISIFFYRRGYWRLQPGR